MAVAPLLLAGLLLGLLPVLPMATEIAGDLSPPPMRFVRIAGSKLRALAEWEMTADARSLPTDRTALVVGASNVRENFDVEAMRDVPGPVSGWVVLPGSGSRVTYVEQNLAALRLYPEIRGHVAVLGLVPWMLSRNEAEGLVTRYRLALASAGEALGRGDMDRSVRTAAKGALNLLQHSRNATDYLLLRARTAWFGVVDAPGVFAPSADLWQHRPTGSKMRAATAELEAQYRGARSRGYFDPRSYQGRNSQTESFVRIVRQLQDRDFHVVVILTPLQERCRTSLPATAWPLASDVLREALGDDAPVVVDLTDSVSEDGFYDMGHLNPVGRQRFSLVAAQAVQRLRRMAVGKASVPQVGSP